MFYFIVAAIVAVALLVLVVLNNRGGGGRRGNLLGPPPGLGRKAPLAPSRAPPPSRGQRVELPESVAAEARRLMAANQKIEAIKLIREETRWSLGEAKDWVERL